jgi:hypothetical protein
LCDNGTGGANYTGERTIVETWEYPDAWKLEFLDETHLRVTSYVFQWTSNVCEYTVTEQKEVEYQGELWEEGILSFNNLQFEWIGEMQTHADVWRYRMNHSTLVFVEFISGTGIWGDGYFTKIIK